MSIQTVPNGQVKVLGHSIKGLPENHRFSGTSPTIDEVEIPSVEDIVVPEIKIRTGESPLKGLVERLKAEKAAKNAAKAEMATLRRMAKEEQKAKTHKF